MVLKIERHINLNVYELTFIYKFMVWLKNKYVNFKKCFKSISGNWEHMFYILKSKVAWTTLISIDKAARHRPRQSCRSQVRGRGSSREAAAASPPVPEIALGNSLPIHREEPLRQDPCLSRKILLMVKLLHETRPGGFFWATRGAPFPCRHGWSAVYHHHADANQTNRAKAAAMPFFTAS